MGGSLREMILLSGCCALIAAAIAGRSDLVSAAPPISAAPEPSSWLMMIIGFAPIGITLRRRTALGIGPRSRNAPIERVVS